MFSVVGSAMSSDFDPLDEIFSEQVTKRSRAGAKFLPMAKPRPRKETSIKIPSSQAVPNIKSVDNETKKSSGNNLESVSEAHSLNSSSLATNSSEHLIGETSVDNLVLQTDVVLPDIHGKPAGEEASINADVDPLDEIFSGHAAKTARADGKFVTNTKPNLQKETTLKLASSQLVPNTNVAVNEASNPAENNLDSIPAVHSFDNSALANNSSEHLIEEALVNNRGHHSDVLLLDINSGEEFSANNLDPLDEIFNENVAKSARAGSKFLPKPKRQSIKGSSIKQPSSQLVQNTRVAANEIERASENRLDDNVLLHSDVVRSDINENPAQENADTTAGLESFANFSFQAATSAVDVASGSQDKVDLSVQLEAPPVPVVSTIEGSAVGVSNASSIETCPDGYITIDTFPLDESLISHSNGGFHFNDKVLEIEEVEIGPCTEGMQNIVDIITTAGKRRPKIQSKPKIQGDTRKDDTSTSNPDGYDAVPCFEHDYSSEVLSNEGLTGPTVTSFPDASKPGDQPVGIFETLEKSAELRERNSIAFDDSLEHQEASISGQDDELGISSRKLRKRKNTYSFVDEDEDDASDVGNLDNDPSSHIEDEDYNDGENEVEKETQTEKKLKRSRKSSSQKEKPARKRKKGNEATDQAIQKPCKKFSHSTRRNRRQVDKVLLETPEDEIDMRKLRLRDIILLAEHRERVAIKEGTSTDTPPANQSTGTSFVDHNDGYFQDEDFDSEGNAPENASNFNYHSHMKKTPRSRWSKQDTELFYEGVRQFGSDISMIQQLFPDRTRAQVKLKYKKEERQQPLRLHDALTNRSGDHSHFQRVIEQLKQLAGIENQNSFEDDSTDLTGNGVEVNLEINEEIENGENMEKEDDEGMKPDVCEAQSPLKPSYDSEDDLSTWCQYKSDL